MQNMGTDISHLYDSFMNSFLLANGLSCMILAEALDPTDLKRMNQFYT